MQYTLIRSRRKSVGIEISREGEVIVRAPLRLPVREIERILADKQDWITRSQRSQALRRENHPEPDEATWRRWQAEAGAYIPGRVAYYAKLMGVVPAKIRFSTARTRFGSCSADNTLMFSLRLMDYSRDAIDYVIVHELAHIRHKNHGKEFYAFVERILPDYKKRQKMLKE